MAKDCFKNSSRNFTKSPCISLYPFHRLFHGFLWKSLQGFFHNFLKKFIPGNFLRNLLKNFSTSRERIYFEICAGVSLEIFPVISAVVSSEILLGILYGICTSIPLRTGFLEELFLVLLLEIFEEVTPVIFSTISPEIRAWLLPVASTESPSRCLWKYFFINFFRISFKNTSLRMFPGFHYNFWAVSFNEFL